MERDRNLAPLPFIKTVKRGKYEKGRNMGFRGICAPRCHRHRRFDKTRFYVGNERSGIRFFPFLSWGGRGYILPVRLFQRLYPVQKGGGRQAFDAAGGLEAH